jgi:hypothetical protein
VQLFFLSLLPLFVVTALSVFGGERIKGSGCEEGEREREKKRNKREQGTVGTA